MSYRDKSHPDDSHPANSMAVPAQVKGASLKAVARIYQSAADGDGIADINANGAH